MRKRSRKQTFQVKHRVYIVGDGDTEKDYFKRIAELNIFPNIVFETKKGNELNFEIFLQEHFDQDVFLILDIDNKNKPISSKCRHTKIRNLWEKYEAENIIFFNNYSFELWLINHKKQFNKAVLSRSGYNKPIQDCFGVREWPENRTQKNRKKIMSAIDQEAVNKAINNIKLVESSTPFKNPSSNMEKLMEILTCINEEAVDIIEEAGLF